MRVFAFAVLVVVALPASADAPAAGEWKLLGTFDGTRVERRENKAGPPTVRCTHVFDAPLERVRPVLADLQWQRWLGDEVSVYKILSRDDDARSALVYGRHKAPWPIQDRDYVVKLTWDSGPDHFVVRSRSVSGVGPKPGKDRVRLQPRGEWALRRAGDKTRFVYTYKGGAGGNIPNWMVEGSYKTQGPANIQRMWALVEK